MKRIDGLMPKRTLILGLIGCLGCSAGPQLSQTGGPVRSHQVAESSESLQGDSQRSAIQPVSHQVSDTTTLGSLVSRAVEGEMATPSSDVPSQSDASVDVVDATDSDRIALNLPSVLASVGGQHPVVGLARWRVQQAYARLAQSKVMWLPTVQAGFSFHRHDGNYQASDGAIIDVNRNSFQYGLGNNATGAGTTQNPGLVARFHLADAIFQPKVAQKTAWAAGHAASAAKNRQLLIAALAYVDLLGAHQDVSILEASKSRTEELAKITRDYSEAGEGLRADADRLQTELALVESRLIEAVGQTSLASARLAQAISLDSTKEVVPTDVGVLPLEMVSVQTDKALLITTGLAMRPELKESQALVAAACEAYRREKYAPFVPSVLLGFSTGGFGGGLGNELDNLGSRYDIDAVMSWQLRNLGLGEKAARAEQSSRVQQAKYETLRVMDQVAREVAEGYAQVQFRTRQIEANQRAITAAQTSYEQNLKRIRDGEGLPLEVLQSLQALETARRAYLQAVVAHNRAQLNLQWAQGWPVTG